MRSRVRGGWNAGVVVVIATVLVIGCTNFPGGEAPVAGSGSVVTEDRQVGEFDKVEGSNGLRLVLSIGATNSVQVSAHENIVPLVSTTVTDGTLEATLTRPVSGTAPITVTVVTPALTALTLHDGVSADATGIAAASLSLDADDGAHASLSGTVDRLTITADNGAFLQLGGLVAANATVSLSNGVTGQVHVTGTMSGTASNGVLLSVVGGGEVSVSTSGGAFITSR